MSFVGVDDHTSQRPLAADNALLPALLMKRWLESCSAVPVAVDLTPALSVMPPVALSKAALEPLSTAPLIVSSPTVPSVSAPPVAVTGPVTLRPPALSRMSTTPADELVVPSAAMVLPALLSVTLAPAADSVDTLVSAADWLIDQMAGRLTMSRLFHVCRVSIFCTDLTAAKGSSC